MSDSADQRRQRERGQWREEFVSQLYRLFKVSRIHDLDNEAAQSALEKTAEDFGEILELPDVEYMDVIFAGDNIFVNGKPLRASREVYHTVLELGELLKEVDFNEVTITPGLTVDNLTSMVEVYLDRREHPGERDDNVVNLGDSIRYRLVDPKKLLDIEEEDDQTAAEQVSEMYPAAVVMMRRFHQAVREQDFHGLRFIKRISQKLVALSDSAAETLLAMTTMRKTRDDKGGISVNAGVLAMLVGRHVTDSYRVLQRLCYSGMVAEIGRPRAAGVYNRQEVPNVIPKLSMSGKEELGPSNALLILRNGRLRKPTLRRAVIAYEAGWLRHEHDIGWPYGDNRRPSIESFIVRVCHRFWDLMALKPSMNARRSPADVFDTLLEEADSKVERAVVQLVMETIAFYERGAIVETSAGWQGVVVQAGERMSNFPRPVVRMVRDGNNNAIDPQDLDLSDPDIDFERFGLVRRQLRNVKDERLLEVARQVRPDDWQQKHATPSSKSRERRNPRSTPSKSEKKERKQKEQGPPPEKSSPDTGGRDDSSAPGAGAIDPGPRDNDSRPGAGTSQSIRTRRHESDEDSSPEDPSVVLEFGPASSNDDGDSSPSPAEQPDSPSRQTDGPPQPEQSGGNSPSQQATDDSSDEGVPELSPGAIEPTESPEDNAGAGDDGPIELGPDQVDPVDEEPVEPEPEGGTQSPVAAQEATQQMSREEATDKLGDFVDREQERANEEKDDGMLRDYVDSVQDDPNVSDRETGARDPQQFNPEELSGETEAVDQPAAGEEDFADVADAAPDDATRQMDSDQSARVLEDFVDETANAEPTAGEGATRQVDAEESHQMLEDYVDEPDDEPAPSQHDREEDGRLGDLATNMSENTSPEEVSKTERVSSEKSHELLRDFVEENSGPEEGVQADGGEPTSADRQESGATEAIDSEKSKELLDSFVDEPSDQGEPHDSGLEDDDRLDQLASDIDEGPPGDDETAKTVANDKSHELMRDFVEETPGSEQESPDEGPADEQLGELVDEAEDMDDGASGDSGATEAISSEKSRELLEDFVDAEQEVSEQGEDDATRQVDAEHSAEVLQDFVDDEEDS